MIVRIEKENYIDEIYPLSLFYGVYKPASMGVLSLTLKKEWDVDEEEEDGKEALLPVATLALVFSESHRFNFWAK